MPASSPRHRKGNNKPSRSPRNANDALYGELVRKGPAKWTVRNLLDCWGLEGPALDSLLDLTKRIWIGLGRPEPQDSELCMKRVVSEWKKRGSPLKVSIPPRKAALRERGLRAIYMKMIHRVRKKERAGTKDGTDAACRPPSNFAEDEEEDDTKASIASDLTRFPSPTAPRARPPPGFYELDMEGAQLNDALHENESPPPQALSGLSTPSIPCLPPRQSLSPPWTPDDGVSGSNIHSVGKPARTDTPDLGHRNETIEKVGERSGPSMGKTPPEREMINLAEFLEWLHQHRHRLDKSQVEDYFETFEVGTGVGDCDSGRTLFRASQGKLNNCRRSRSMPSLSSTTSLLSPPGFSDDGMTGVSMAFWECLASAVYELEWTFIEQTLKAHEVGDKIFPALTNCQTQLKVELNKRPAEGAAL